ncbi:BSD domain-containing protein 1 [Linum grandiflorum]
MQSNLNTYCTEPEDSQGYGDWRFGFGGSVVEEKREEIEKLLGESEVVREIYDEVMPSKVNIETFWSRYFYRVQKLKEAEEARAKIVKRAISAEEEDLSWDFDDEEDDRVVTNKPSMPIDGTEVVEKMRNKSNDRRESGEVGHEIVHHGTNVEGVKEDGGSWDDQSSTSKKVEEKAGTNVRGEELCKDNDVSVVLNQQQQQEIEELGWNEIEEDIGDDSSNNTNGEKGDDGAISRVDLRKRLSCAEEDEDLSWDIEDDDDDDGESARH